GDRVWVDFVAPKGAVVIGRVPTAPTIYGEAYQYGTGWGPGSAQYGVPTLGRTPDGRVQMTGAAVRYFGTGIHILNVPLTLDPAYDERFAVWTSSEIELLYVSATGEVIWAGTDPIDVSLNVSWAPKIGGT